MLPFVGLLAQANSVVGLPVASHSAHCVLFSPPYWGHRDYRGAGGEHFPEVTLSLYPGVPPTIVPTWQGDYGQEPTPEAYVAHTVALMRDVSRVLRPDGVAWVNVGDSFFGGASGGSVDDWPIQSSHTGSERRKARRGLPNGTKANIPGRLWLALQADGWIVRMDHIWHKPNPMPDPADGWRWEKHRIKIKKAVEDWRKFARDKDGVIEGAVAHVAGGNYGFTHKPKYVDCVGCKVCEPNGGYVIKRGSWRHTVSHEVVLQCVRQMQYWSDAEIVAEEAKPEAWGGSGGTYAGEDTKDYGAEGAQSPSDVKRRIVESGSLTRNPRSVATVPTANYPGQHSATFPPDLIRPLILSSVPRRCCSVCGVGWVPVIERSKHPTRDMEGQRAADADVTGRTDGHISGPSGEVDTTAVMGYRAACNHDAPPIPGLLVDPFCGSGTSGEVAREAGLRFIGFDLSLQYLSDQARVRVLRGTPPDALKNLPLFGGGV